MPLNTPFNAKEPREQRALDALKKHKKVKEATTPPVEPVNHETSEVVAAHPSKVPTEEKVDISLVATPAPSPVPYHVYGNLTVDAVGEAGTCFKAGTKLLLEYPMREQDGKVFMKARMADPVTGQLSEDVLTIYDGDLPEPYIVQGFTV